MKLSKYRVIISQDKRIIIRVVSTIIVVKSILVILLFVELVRHETLTKLALKNIKTLNRYIITYSFKIIFFLFK